jgi:membrane fusion protein (multidrug efflux system)
MSTRCRSAAIWTGVDAGLQRWSRPTISGSRPSPKETELTYVKPGQTATISVDTYPGADLEGQGREHQPGLGSSFSLLPAQNTTGNWVKVVQRIPMRVTIEDTAGKPPLRVGMSTVVDVDTGHARGLPDFVSKLSAPAAKDHE